MVNRISNRLKKLEETAAAENSDANKMLVELLGRRDALFFPWRTRAANHGHIFWELQRAYWAGKRGQTAKGSGVADWESASQQRSILIDRGLAKPLRTAGGEIGQLKITPLGEATARALVGHRLYTFHDLRTRCVYTYLCCMFDVCQPWLDGRWMSENLLWQRTLHGNPVAWNWLTEAVLPLITAGLVKQSYDIPGRLYFSLRHWDSDGKLISQSLDAPTVDVEVDPAMDDVYLSAYEQERDLLEKLPATNEVHIPLPASCFHTFMDETTLDQHKDKTDEAEREKWDRFAAVLESRKFNSELQDAIEKLESYLAESSAQVDLEL